ncbi:hypothetical protein ES705_07854 [subsurface metagenome]
MSKRIADLTCPECQKPIQVPFEVKEPPTLDDITNTLNEALKGHLTADQVQKVIQEQLEGLKPSKGYHEHKTFDELFECPGCKPFVETAQRYQVIPKEPAPGPKEQPVGSIFGAKTED